MIEYLSSGNSSSCFSANPFVIDEQQYPKCQKYPTDSVIRRKGGKDCKEESSSDLFHGILAIGTLCSETVITQHVLPTSAVSFMNKPQEETRVSEKDLKLIYGELEKFIEGEAEKEGFDKSYGRSSHVSSITFAGKTLGRTETNEKMVVSPLGGYLLGSATESPTTNIELVKGKASLKELLQMSKLHEDVNPQMKIDSGKNQGNTKIKSTMHFVKKMMHLGKSSVSSNDGDTAKSTSIKRKLPKVSVITLDCQLKLIPYN